MRFNKNLQDIAEAYRFEFLGSTNEKDLIQRPDLWTQETVILKKIIYFNFSCITSFSISSRIEGLLVVNIYRYFIFLFLLFEKE